MILQVDVATLYLWAFIIAIIASIILFIIGVIVTRWWAGRKEWSKELKSALLLNLFWLVINIALGWLWWGIIALIINIIVGGWLASKLYEKELKESIIFVIVVIIILFIIWIILVLILTVVIVVTVLGISYGIGA
jgi:hypothetical protein